MENENLRARAKRELIRVTMPDGEIICFTSVKETYVQTLMRIDPEQYGNISLEYGHLPLLSKVVHPKYAKYMVQLRQGWYVNTAADTKSKYMQLKQIAKVLNLDMEVEISTDFKGEKVERGFKGMAGLTVGFPDGTVIGEELTADTFAECIWKLGVETIYKKNLEYGGRPLITNRQMFNGQVQVDKDRWLTMPNTTKDKVKMLNVIAIYLNVKLDISYF